MERLLEELADDPENQPGEVPTTWGEVTTASPLEVTFAGDTTPVRVTRKIDAYLPVVADTVALVRFGSKWVAVGKIGAA